jgi:hypothetical protein
LLLCIIFSFYTYTTPYICFGACKCIYYILLMNIPSCKSMSISCGWISKLNLFFYNWPLWLVLHKKSWYFDTPQVLTFSTNMGLWWCYSNKYFECTFCSTSLLLLLLLLLWVVFNNNFYYQVLLIVAFTRT